MSDVFTYEDLNFWDRDEIECEDGWNSMSGAGDYDIRIGGTREEYYTQKGDSPEDAVRKLLTRLNLPKDEYEVEIEGGSYEDIS